jgi:hypothetical protein
MAEELRIQYFERNPQPFFQHSLFLSNSGKINYWVDKTNIFEMINTLVISQDCLQLIAVIHKGAVTASASQSKLMGQVSFSL